MLAGSGTIELIQHGIGRDTRGTQNVAVAPISGIIASRRSRIEKKGVDTRDIPGAAVLDEDGTTAIARRTHSFQIKRCGTGTPWAQTIVRLTRAIEVTQQDGAVRGL
jgi:hypothetical protein